MASTGLRVREEMSFEGFQDGHHGGHWILEWNDFSNFESLCHQVSAQSDLGFRRLMLFENFKMAAILDIGTE